MVSALLFGLLSSLHCIGMCGPIALMLPVHRDSLTVKMAKTINYHLGRIFSYSLLGGLFALFGKGFFIAGLQQKFAIVIGLLMILYSILPVGKWEHMAFLRPLHSVTILIKGIFAKQLKKNSLYGMFIIGIANGLLPCAMVYIALFGATATQEPALGMLYMALFGVGTIPLMSGVVYFSQAISVTVRSKILKILPVLIVVLGALFIVRGLGLDIPFLSPGTLRLFVSANPTCFT